MYKMKRMLSILMVILVLVGCQSKPKEEETTPLELSIESVVGLEDIDTIKDDYFRPLKDVSVINESNEDISYLLNVTGHVNYGVPGTYTLNYYLEYGNDVIDQDRTITVKEGTISRETQSRQALSNTPVALGSGSYRVGSASDIAHPTNPTYINTDLLDQAVPSNSWWTSLLVSNYGGGNGIYTNPLRSAFSNYGAEITNPGPGFVQYWNPEGYLTMANFSIPIPDLYLKTSSLNEGYVTQVVDYSDTTVNVSMRNNLQPEDHMVLTYAQGSPFVFAEVKSNSTPSITLNTAGITGYEFYTLDNTQLTDDYVGSSIVIKLIQKHVGYVTSLPASVGQALYDDRYFVVSAPEDTVFGITNNKVTLDLNGSNIFSVAAIDDLSEANYYAEHAYTRTMKGSVNYTVDHETSVVETTYHMSTQTISGSVVSPLQFLMPHHYANQAIDFTQYQLETVRGILKLYEGQSFKTEQTFSGVIPAMTLPTNQAFSETNMVSYLDSLNQETELTDTANFLNDEGPYWNSKALYPLAQGIIIADQMDESTIRDEMIGKLRYLLRDWYTYSSSADERYLYYNEPWGSIYYSSNDFNTASELSDHAFTHGYLIYASSVLAMYDQTFAADYGDMVSLLLSEYMTNEKGSYDTAYLRSFDPWAGHTWAHGFGTFAEGNNIESTSEAIQSWVGGYLWALQTGDESLRDAAIYGFVHELASAKMYHFDYENIVFKDNYEQYASVAGMIWGGKYDFATWFGANPTFIYGIQWLPNGEYISSYALNSDERTKLTTIFDMYLDSKNQVIDTWFANMWSIQALINPDQAIQMFDANKILNDDYPADLSQTYYLIHGLASYGQRTTEYVMKLDSYASSSIYMKDSNVYALVWNPSSESRSLTFYGPNGSTIHKTVGANQLVAIKLN